MDRNGLDGAALSAVRPRAARHSGRPHSGRQVVHPRRHRDRRGRASDPPRRRQGRSHPHVHQGPSADRRRQLARRHGDDARVGRPENTGQSRRRETRASYGRKDRQIILGERSDDADRRKRRPPRRKHRMDDRETRRCPQSVASEALPIFPRKSEKRFGNRSKAVPESFLYTLSNILSTTADGRQKTAEIRPDRIFRRIPVRAFDKSAGTSEKI